MVNSQSPRRGRPPGRTAAQEAKRQENRAAIRAASAQLLSRKTYLETTIDDLLHAAQVSRATFYTYFPSKLDVALEIYESIRSDWMAHFERLAGVAPHDEVGVSEWTRGLVQLYLDHGFVTPLVEQIAPFEPKFRARLASDRNDLIDYLASLNIAGFVAALGAEAHHVERRVQLNLALVRLDQICSMLARGEGGSAAEKQVYIRIISKELASLMV